jgi:hypothetical protein
MSLIKVNRMFNDIGTSNSTRGRCLDRCVGVSFPSMPGAIDVKRIREIITEQVMMEVRYSVINQR